MPYGFPARRNISSLEIRDMITASKVKAVRMVVDEISGDRWYWPAELATHKAGAHYLGIKYTVVGGGPVLIHEPDAQHHR